MSVMILAAHILIAISSMIFTSYLYFRPAQKLFMPAYALLGSTLASGTLLVVVSQVNILKTCLTGIGYLVAVSIGIALANRKLAAQEATLE